MDSNWHKPKINSEILTVRYRFKMLIWLPTLQAMSNTAIIDDWDAFIDFLSAQPLCLWSIQKQHEINTGKHLDKVRSPIHTPTVPKEDNAKLAEALATMA